MTKHYNVSVNLSNLQLNKLSFAIKNATEVTIRLSPSMIGANKTNFLHDFLLADWQL